MTKKNIVFTRKPKEITGENQTISTEAKPTIENGTVLDFMVINKLRYTLFLVFFAYLKAAKLGNAWNGGWLYNKLRISQQGNSYRLTHNSKEYNISPTESDDISDVILYHI